MPLQFTGRMRLVIVVILCVLAAAPYAQTWRHDFVNYDDNLYVTENSHVQQGLTIDNIGWAFTTTEAANWHPLTWLSHMLDWSLFRDWAGGHHVINVVLHALNTLFLWFALQALTASRWRSAVVAALFAVHPLHVESVAWIAERKDVLSTLFGLLAMWMYARYVQRRSGRAYAAMVCCFALSLLAKPMLVTLPFVFLLLDYWPLQRWTGRARLILLEKAPLFLLSAASSAVTFAAQRSGEAVFPVEVVGFTSRTANAIVAYASYLAKTVWPFDLAVLYPLQTNWPPTVIAVSTVVLVVISALAIFYARARPHLIVGWLWFIGTLVPVIGFVQVGYQSMADRYTYVPLIGVFIMIAWSLPERKTKHSVAGNVAIGALSVVIVLLAVRGWDQVRYWRDSFTLFHHARHVTTGNFIAEHNLGHAYFISGGTEDAIRHYLKSIEIMPRYGLAHDGLGVALLGQDRRREAIEHLEQAVRLLPRVPRTRHNLAAAYEKAGRIQDAVAAYQDALHMQPNLVDTRVNLGNLYWQERQGELAIEQYELALQQRPAMLEVRLRLGMALAATGRLEEAIAQFQRVLDMDPLHVEALQYLELARRQNERTSQPDS